MDFHQLALPDGLHMVRVIPQGAACRVLGLAAEDLPGHLAAFLPGDQIHRFVAAPVAPPGKLATVTHRFAALLHYLADVRRKLFVPYTIDHYVTYGEFSLERFSARLEVNVEG